MKNSSFIRITSIFLMVLIPLIYLYAYFDKYEEKERKTNVELIKEQFLTEMDKFQEDLKPEKHIEKAFKELEKKFGFPDSNDSQYKYTIEENDKIHFIDKEFIIHANNYLKENYGFEPFIFLCSGYDFTNINIKDKYNIFPNNITKNKFLYTCIGSILCFSSQELSIYDFFYNFNFINIKNEKLFLDIKNKIYNFCNSDLKYAFNLEMAKNISIFYRELGRPCNSFAFFTNKNGNQTIYQFYNSFIPKEKNKHNFLGLYYALIKSNELPINKLIDVACNNQFSNIKNIKRKISNVTTKLPKWEITDKKIIYRVPLPFHLYNLILQQKTVNEDIFNLYNDYFQKHSLELSFDKDLVKSQYYYYKIYILSVIVFLFFFLFLYFFNLKCKFINKEFSLSKKIRIIVSIAVLIPMTGLWFISSILIDNEQKEYLSNIDQKISERMDLFDKIKEDIVYDFSFDLLKHKKIISDTYFSLSPQYFYSEFINSRTKRIKDLIKLFFKNIIISPYNIFANIIILDINGDNVAFYNDDENGSKQKLTKFINLYNILSDMDLLDQNTKENRANQTSSDLIMTYTGSYYSTINNNNILAKENMLIPGEGLTLKDKITYQLLTSEKSPTIVKALIYSFVSMRNIMSFRLTLNLIDKYPKLLEQNFDNVQVKYAIFERNASEFKEKINQGKSYPFRQYQIEAAKIAMIKGRSGTDIQETHNNYFLKKWLYYSDNPLIIVGVAIIPKKQTSLINKKIITILLFVYAILVVVLLSDFFADALLEPIRTLSKFIKEIEIGNLNVKIKMKSGDELEELGDSFNKMSIGLCEREKLKRFVSDKLYTSLEGNKEQKPTKTRVTILSSDIRSFTTISEKNTPEEVVILLNDYFTIMEESIVKYGGSIEKIVGDAISAAFYEEKSKEYALNACRASLEMRENLKKFNQNRIARNKFTIENGIGLATGEVITGFAGEKSRRREFLLIGNILKSAENLEAMTKKAVSSKVFIDKNTFDIVKNDIKLCPEKNDEDIFFRELAI